MRTNRTSMVMLAVFALTLGAGVVAGLLAARLPSAQVAPAVTEPGTSPLAAELALNPDQREKMKKIWENVSDLSRDCYAASKKLESRRDNAIEKLIPAEKVTEYNDVRRKYAEDVAKLVGQREVAFDSAVKETRAILTEPQRKKYDEILKKRLAGESAGGHDPAATPATPMLDPATRSSAP